MPGRGQGDAQGVFRGKPNGADLSWDFGTWSSSSPSSQLPPAKSVLCKDISSQGGDNMRNSSCFRAGFPISSSLEMSLLLIRHFHWKSSNCQQQFTHWGSVIFCSNLVNGALWKQVLRCLLDHCSQRDSSRFSFFGGLRFWYELKFGENTAS